MKEFELKNGKKILVELQLAEVSNGKNKITAFDASTNKKIGHLHFNVERGSAYIYTIRVEDVDFLQKGVGTIMLKCFEKYCTDKRVGGVDGRFYPTGEGGEFSKRFYETNGYKIYKEGNEQSIDKYFDLNKVNPNDDTYSLEGEREFEQ